MSRNTRGIAALLVSLTALATGAFTAAPALAGLPLENWAVWGSLTPKKINEPVILPKGSTYNGEIALTKLTETEVEGTAKGSLFVPPFVAPVKLVGLLPTEVHITFKQVGTAEGLILPAAASTCAGERFAGLCATLEVTAKADIGITEAGLLGIGVPTECETSEPVTFALSDTLSLGELLESGARFKGTTTIPSIKCGGLSGIVVGALLTELMSGPDNPYAINLGPHEPAAPAAVTEPASSVSQISAMLRGTVDPDGEEVSDCHFEYGSSSSYGASVPCVSRQGAGNNVSATLTGLGEGSTYHYRVVATNPLGTSYGADQAFTTLGPAGAPEYGQCAAQKKGNYADSNCTRMAEKKGQPVEHKGGYEWVAGPAASCVAQKKGQYTDSSCTTRAAKAGKGSYETAPGPGYASTSGTVTLETPGFGRTITCAASTAEGRITGLSSGVDRVTFTGCESAGKRCSSEGPNSTPSGIAGVIVTNLLDTRLLGPVEGQVWTELASAEHGPYVAEFGCEGPLLRTSGSVSGIQTGDVNVSSATSKTTFALPTGEKTETSKGEQALSTSLSESGGSSWAGPDVSSLLAVVANTAASAIEIRP
jgi:hypothetical protein